MEESRDKRLGVVWSSYEDVRVWTKDCAVPAKHGYIHIWSHKHDGEYTYCTVLSDEDVMWLAGVLMRALREAYPAYGELDELINITMEAMKEAEEDGDITSED